MDSTQDTDRKLLFWDIISTPCSVFDFEESGSMINDIDLMPLRSATSWDSSIRKLIFF